MLMGASTKVKSERYIYRYTNNIYEWGGKFTEALIT